jgi:ATP:ADP antiporter, AAA family
MRDKILSLLGIESGEESMVLMLLTQSVFLGIFLGSFDISAHSLFLSIFDEKMMAKAYVVSGVAGIILTSVYTWVQTRMQFKNFAIFNLVAVTSFTLLLWIALLLTPSKVIIFAVFIMLGPLNILAMLGFWGTAGRLFTLRQGKRLFGLVDVGMIIGFILSCYTVPVILSFNFASHNILLISAFSVLLASVLQIIIGAKFKFFAGGGEGQDQEGIKEEKKSVLKVFAQDPYTRTMAIFIALSVMTAFFVQYSFMAVTREQYPAEEDMARFLGIFTGSMMIFTLLVKLTVFSYLIRNYGLKTCLAISPLLIAVFTIIAILIGMFMGYTSESAGGFLIFFMLLALSRLFSKSLKDSIESPSFKVIYQTIDEKIRFEIQSGMDGTVNEIAALTSGLLLAGLGILSFIKLIHFSLALLFIISIWILVAFKLYTEYRKSIRKALETVTEGTVASTEGSDSLVLKNRFSSNRAFRTDYFNLISGNFSGLENNNSKWFFKSIIDYSGSRHDVNLIPALRKIAAYDKVDSDIRMLSADIIQVVEKPLSSGKPEDEKIISASAMLSGTRLPHTTEVLRLLRDNSIESKRLGIFMIGKFKITDMLPEVCECLNIQGLETDATAVLKTFGEESVEELIRFYLISSGNQNTSKTILRLLGKINTKESTGFLFSRLWSNSRQLKEVAVKCLIDCEYKPSEEDLDRLNQYISDIVGIMTWNLTAKICLGKSNDTQLLEVLKREINRWNRFLFDILSITYDSGSIMKIRKNLDKETVESVNYALEMIDIVIESSIKPKLIALLDMVPDEEKIKNLYHFFPGEIPSYNKLLEDIINRDYNILSLWTKACTLRRVNEIEGDDMAESIVALLFSPEGILQEESARLIARSSKELYKSASVRIQDSTKRRLDSIVNGETNESELIFEKVKFLSSCFTAIPEEELISLAGYMGYVPDSKSGLPLLIENCILWSVKDQGSHDGTFIYFYDQINGAETKFQNIINGAYYILPLNAVEEFSYQCPEWSNIVLRYIDINEE